jgi:biotin carboxylase
MRVLLSEGSGLTSRQVAGRLAALGHHVGVVSCDPIGITRFTRATKAWRAVPAFGADPLGWLDATLDAYADGGYDVLLPTQEQVTVLAAFPGRLADAGVVTAVPCFGALRAVQDKVSAHATLERLGLPRPEATVAASPADLVGWDRFPVYVKAPIGTATSGVRHVADRAELDAVLAADAFADAFADGGVLVQHPVGGPLMMVQSVFQRGRLVAFHANVRARLGVRGGASHKRSIDVPEVRELMARLGGSLGWHGALSADVVLGPDGPSVIDVNPRLVEPGNALRSGTDLTAALLDVALGCEVAPCPAGRADVRTHQLVLAVLGAAEQGRGRRGVAAELAAATRHRGDYAGSIEELTPLRRDARAVVPLALAVVLTLAHPPAWQHLASGSVANYALTPAGWRTICAAAEVDA